MRVLVVFQAVSSSCLHGYSKHIPFQSHNIRDRPIKSNCGYYCFLEKNFSFNKIKQIKQFFKPSSSANTYSLRQILISEQSYSELDWFCSYYKRDAETILFKKSHKKQ